jgi:hypothetical protein
MRASKRLSFFLRMVGLLFFFIVIVIGFGGEVQAQVPAPFLITPYYGSFAISQGYSTEHPAYDFLLRYDRVLAAAHGTIERVRWFNNNPACINGGGDVCGYGLHIYLRDTVTGYQTRYAHLSATAFDLDPIDIGTTVWSGRVIGTSGNTGWSTGPHLHFEVKDQNLNPVNPFNPNLWRDGEHVGHPLSKPPTNGEIIVDDNTTNSQGFSKGRNGPFNNPCPPDSCPNWLYLTGGTGFPDYMHNGDMHHTSVSNADYWAMWQPSGLVDGGGMYEVFVHIPDETDTSSSTWQAAYTIVHTAGYTTARVAQGSLPNPDYGNSQWVSLGTYHLGPGAYVYTTGATGEVIGEHCGLGQWCELAVDAIKFVRLGSTYLPGVKDDGWSSGIVLQSNNGLVAWVSLAQYGSNGTYLGRYTGFVVPNGNAVYTTSIVGTKSIVIDSTQDISVVSRQSAVGRGNLDNTLLSNPLGDSAFERTGTILYAPAVYNNIFGGWNTAIELMNTGSVPTNVTFYFKGRAGYPDTTVYTYNIPANGYYQLNSSSVFYSYPVGGVCSYRLFTGGLQEQVGFHGPSADLGFYDRDGT